jgi:hypothetical protein
MYEPMQFATGIRSGGARGMHRALRAPYVCGLLLCFVGCRAAPPEFVFGCTLDADCPPSQACGADGLCSASPRIRAGSANDAVLAGAGGKQEPTAGEPSPAASADDTGVAGASAGGAAPSLVAGSGPAGASAEPAGAGAIAGSGNAGASAAPGLALGSACSTDEACQSGQCVNERCCSEPICPICRRCNDRGACEVIVNAPDPAGCSGRQTCDGQGRCGMVNGQSCTDMTAVLPCASGVCDYRCCALTCGVCQRCASNGGRCDVLNAADDADTCTGANTCSKGQCVVAEGTRQHNGEIEVPPRANIAQTFTIPSAGTLVEIRTLWSFCAEVGYSLQTVGMNGLPSGTSRGTVQTRIRNNEDVLDTLIAVEPTLPVAAGERLALVFENLSTSTPCSASSAGGDTYAGGKVMTLDSAAGSTWQIDAAHDLTMLAVISP